VETSNPYISPKKDYMNVLCGPTNQ